MTYVYLTIASVLGLAGILRVVLPTLRIAGANWRRYKDLRTLAAAGPLSGSVSGEGIASLREADTRAREAFREDFVVTGSALAALGLAAVFLGQAMGYGVLAVAAYATGLVCIVLGVALALLGSVVRLLARPLVRRDGDS